jgi:hypothetical protein
MSKRWKNLKKKKNNDEKKLIIKKKDFSVFPQNYKYLSVKLIH